MTQSRAAANLFLTFFLLITSFFAVIIVVPVNVKATTRYVGGTGPGNYTTIGAAVGAALDGDTVFVYNGTYTEQIGIGRIISLVGENKDTTIIDGNGAGNTVFVNADWVTVRGFTIRNSGSGTENAGISIGSVQYSYIANNNIVSNYYGVFIGFSRGARVLGNNISSNRGYGIFVETASRTNIAGNTLYSNTWDAVAVNYGYSNTIDNNTILSAGGGIYIHRATGITVTRNTITNGGIGMHGQLPEEWNTHVFDDNNTANGKTIYYWKNRVGGTIPPNAGGVILANTTGVVVENQNLNGGYYGVEMGYSSKIVVANNTLSSNSRDGVYPWYSYGYVIANNTISRNREYAFNMWYSSGVIYHNNVIDSSNQGIDTGSNQWDDGYPSGGNYWCMYKGFDNSSGPLQDQPGSDGIGDTPFDIPWKGNKDRFPLMKPISPRLPDLVAHPSNVSFSPNPPFREGSSITINAKIWNAGLAASGPTVARFYDGLPPSPRIGEDQPMASIPARNATNVSVAWTPLAAGSHDICVVADPENGIAEINETNNIACVRVEVNFSLQLTPGHRFMSFPVVVSDDSIGAVLSSISGCYDYVRWFDPLDAASPWKSYVPGRGRDSLLGLDNTMGFWINITAACAFTPGGTAPSTTSVLLYQGWNMVGYPSFNASYSVADLKADLGLAGVIVEAFDSNAAPYYLQRLKDGHLMEPGEGYWIYVPSDTTWIVGG